MGIELKHIQKHFGSFHALRGIDLHIQTGELMALLGPSGSGKTTLLRIIAGLEYPDDSSSRIFFGDEDVTNLHPRDRGVGFVFQHYALFRHMTVFDNISFGLRIRARAYRPSKQDIKDKVNELLHLVQLDKLGDRYPSQLSGGQRQRVALARALAVDPKVLLLDEPFGALDARVRRELRRWLRELHYRTGVTTVFVTHDQEEAMEVSDRVTILHEGNIEQLGTPDHVYEKPATAFVYNFLGNVNLFHGQLESTGMRIAPNAIMHHTAVYPHNGQPTAFVRPHEIELVREPSDTTVPIQILHVNTAGSIVRIYADRLDAKQSLEIEITRETFKDIRPEVGQRMYALLKHVSIMANDYAI